MMYNINLKDLFNRIKPIIAIITIVLLIATIIVLSVLLAKSEQKSVQTATNVEETTETTTFYEEPDFELLFNTDDDAKVFFHDFSLGEVWIPLLKDVPLSPYKDENYKMVNGLKHYYEDDELKSIAGIDVSIHQGDINWEKVKAAGIDFAMIRVGYTGYQTGESYIDSNFKKNIEGALNAGLDVGAYFFSQAINVEEAIREAELMLDAIKDYKITYPVVYDWEVIYDDEARTDGMSVNMLTNATIAFCETVKSAGYTPMVYANRKQAYLKLDLSRLKDYDFWLAEYNPTTSYTYNYQIWQYSSTGRIDGIKGDVDLNISFIDYGERYRKAHGEAN
ncbi:MAG: glycoside hydrolase [Clostridiales bacterium]|nr:glycoside hydrolase [Clostridiales bacterium]